MRVVETAALALIGNELLSGKIQDANLLELARTLRAIGVRLTRVVMLPDEIDTIATEVRALADTHDVVFTSGGVGPTHDDVSLEAVAAAFGVPALMHDGLRAMLERAYGERCTPGHLRMALVPEGAELAVSEEVSWPTVVMRNVWVLPGVPEIFRMKLAVVRAHLRGPRAFVSRAVFTGMDEGELKALLDRVVAGHGEVEVGSYPKFFDPSYRTKITFDARDRDKVDAALEAFLALLPAGEPLRVD